MAKDVLIVIVRQKESMQTGGGEKEKSRNPDRKRERKSWWRILRKRNR